MTTATAAPASPSQSPASVLKEEQRNYKELLRFARSQLRRDWLLCGPDREHEAMTLVSVAVEATTKALGDPNPLLDSAYLSYLRTAIAKAARRRGATRTRRHRRTAPLSDAAVDATQPDGIWISKPSDPIATFLLATAVEELLDAVQPSSLELHLISLSIDGANGVVIAKELGLSRSTARQKLCRLRNRFREARGACW